MQSFFLRTYNWIHHHRIMGSSLLLMVIAVCLGLIATVRFSENITDFLPVDEHYATSMKIYQDVASANKVVLQFVSESGTDSIIDYIEKYGELLPEYDTLGWVADFEPQIDYSRILDVAEFVYGHLPYFLDEEDYVRMDSLMRDPEFNTQRLTWIADQISGIAGSYLLPVVQNDPLGMGNRIAGILQQYQPETTLLQQDGYVFTPDSACCLVMIDSPFGGSESGMNGQLAEMLTEVSKAVGSDNVQLRLTGAPVIAAGNAECIRRDTILSVSVSVILILTLLLFAFRRVRAILYIVLSTAFGFLMALAGLALLGGEVSLIVIGIASVIIGIAVNYPLHYVCHSQEVSDSRSVIRDLVQPLLVGNITTVAAFLTLVPLDAVSIRQLGLFSALMLIGTILFVLVVMPHLPSVSRLKLSATDDTVVTVSAMDRLIAHPLSVILVAAITAVMGWLSMSTSFDSDLSHLNYMTDIQRSDMKRLSLLQGQPDGVVVYFPSDIVTLEDSRQAIDSLIRLGIVIDEKNPSFLIPSEGKQQQRIAMWQSFWQTHDYHSFFNQSRLLGFSEEAFEPFQLLIEDSLPILHYEDFSILTHSILQGYCNSDYSVARLTVADQADAAIIEAVLPGAFDLPSLNSKVTDALTADFNYIGFACAFIVFAFLWLSFGRLEVAFIAFIPMVVGWLWILGLMQLLDIHFNVVNIILATFIFGQGDDYTIFITEGLVRDYRQGTGHKILVGYQRSIILSAIIMLVGIGSLIVSDHPAMFSLAEVTIIGMSVVVLMAWILPPMLFHWLLKIDRPLRNWLSTTKE